MSLDSKPEREYLMYFQLFLYQLEIHLVSKASVLRFAQSAFKYLRVRLFDFCLMIGTGPCLCSWLSFNSYHLSCAYPKESKTVTRLLYLAALSLSGYY